MLERIGKYHVIRAAGSGGFGTVYEGYDVELDRNVAIKICTGGDSQLERFRREARVVSQLKHRNIALVFDFGYDEQGHVHYLVEEFLSGVDLDKKLEERDRLPPALRLLYMIGIAQGLEFVHDRGLIHRDLSPRNIRVLHDHTIKIMDFGLAKDVTDSTLTMIGDNFGTIGYTAPEQVTGMRTVDHRTDIFSFGVIAYELLTLYNPFMADNMGSFIQKIHHHAPRPLDELWSDCPEELAEAVHRCMHKDPDERFGSCSEVLPVLKKVLRHLRNHDVPIPFAPPEEEDDSFDAAMDAVGQKMAPGGRRRGVDSGQMTSNLKAESTNPLFNTPMPLAPATKPADTEAAHESSFDASPPPDASRGRLPGYLLGIATAVTLAIVGAISLRPGGSDQAVAEPAPPVARPATTEPATTEPTTAKPTTAKPTTAKPATAKPATAEALSETSDRSDSSEPPETPPHSASWVEPVPFELQVLSTGTGDSLAIQIVASLPELSEAISHCYVLRSPSWSYGAKIRYECGGDALRYVDNQEILAENMYTYEVQVANAAGDVLAESVKSSVIAGD